MLRFASVLFFATPVFAQDLAPGLAQCAAISSDLQRLTCYDTIAAAAPKDAVPPTPASAGAWQVSQETNPMDDTQTVIMILPESGEGSALGRKAAIILRCTSSVLEAYISWQDYLASDGGYDSHFKNVTLRWDGEKPNAQDLSASTDATATFFDAPMSIFKSLQDHQKLVAQVVPYNSGPKTASFDLAGLAQSAAPLIKACNLQP